MQHSQHRVLLAHSSSVPATTLATSNNQRVSFIDITLMIAIAIIVVFGHSVAYADSEKTSRLQRSEITTGVFQLQSAAGTVDEALLQRMEVDIDVQGILARVVVRQTFENTSDEWVEGEYLFPLPTEAAVDYMEMTIGDRKIVGEIKEKQKAKEIYEQAKQAGKKASLVTQHRPNLFKNRVANIAPGETIHIELHYVETIVYRDNKFSMRIPTTLTPRYNGSVGKTLLEVPVTSVFTETANAAPLYFTANLNTGFSIDKIESVYHSADTQFSGKQVFVQLHPGATLNKDVVLQWTPILGEEPQVSVLTETQGDSHYAAVMLMPPKAIDKNLILPRETIFIIDTSGSMQGESIRQARNALLTGLDLLQSTDRFNIIEFNSTTNTLWPDARPVDPQNLKKAKRFVNGLRADGGTEIQPALQQALRHSAPQGYIRQIVFMTDGSVSNEVGLFELIHRQLGDNRLFTVGIGSAPNSHFMEKAAAAGRGSFTYINDLKEIDEKVSRLFEKLQYPVLTDIVLDTQGQFIEKYPSKIPDLYAGEPIAFVGKFKHTVPSTISINGRRGDELFAKAIQFHQPKPLITKLFTRNHENAEGGNASPKRVISKLWGRGKLKALYDAENQATYSGDQQLAEFVRDEITQVALDHQLLSRYTSFIAVEQIVARPASESLNKKIIPNAMPQGSTMTIPQGALGIQFYFYIAIVFFLLSLLLATDRGYELSRRLIGKS